MRNINYSTFLSAKDALTFEECQKIHQTILNNIGNDEEILKVWSEFLQASISYAHIRSQWLLWEREERQQKDEGRTAKHERVIYCLKLPSRYLGQEGVDVSWFDSIEDNRKQIGDFACYIAYIYSINAR